MQIAKSNQATLEQGKTDGDKPATGKLVDTVPASNDDSWLPPARGYREVEDTSEGQSEQDLQDKIKTKWPQVSRGISKVAAPA